MPAEEQNQSKGGEGMTQDAIRFDPTHFTPTPGITLIEASAGTGKTYNITQIVCNLIAEGTCRINEVLVLTFTETATQELRSRIRTGITEALANEIEQANERAIVNLSIALDNFESASIFTIHGFCNRILREFAVETGLGPEFAILKQPKEVESALELKIARKIQKIAAQNPLLPIGVQSLGLKTSFTKSTCNLKAAADLNKFRETQNHGENLKQWFRPLIVDLRSAWLEDKTKIRAELLADKPPVQRRRAAYKPAGLTALMDRMEQVFEQDSLYLEFLNDIQNLSYQTLSDPKVVAKDRTIEPLGFYLVADRVKNELETLSISLVGLILEMQQEQSKQLVFQEQQLRFDDLLDLAQKLVCDPSNTYANYLYQNYKVGLVDEFQDTDALQLSILEKIFLTPPSNEPHPRPLILIGDPKQAIYGFRGGDIFTYNSAKKQAKQTYFLDTNWRSSPAINNGINELLACSNTPFGFDWIDYQPVATADKNLHKALHQPSNASNPLSGIHWVELEETSTEHQKYQLMAKEIENLLQSHTQINTDKGSRVLQPNDIAILVPKNQMAADIQEVLGQHRIPATIFGGTSVFQSQQSQHLYAVLNALLNLRDFSLVRGALAGALFEDHLATIDPQLDPSTWTNVLKDFTTAAHLWKSNGLSSVLSYMEHHYSWKLQLSKGKQPHRALANQQQLINLLLQQETAQPHDPHSLLRWYREQIEEPDKNDQDQLLQLDTDTAAVTIMTMHKSKGLEFPVVYIPSIPEPKKETYYPNQFHDPTTGELRTNLSEQTLTPTIKTQMESEIRSELLRTLYVAITRAEIYCTVYLQEKKSGIGIIDSWLPAGNVISDRVEQLQTAAVGPDEDTFIPSGDDRTSSPSFNTLGLGSQDSSQPFKAPPPAPVAPAPITNLSFTGIINGSLHHQNDFTIQTDEPVLFTNPTSARKTPEHSDSLSIHDFDKGTNAGLMFHDLLEYADFQNPRDWVNLLNSKLEYYGYSAKVWTPVLLPWFENLISQPISTPDGEQFSLSELTSAHSFRETEFSYPAKWNATTWNQLTELFSNSEWVQDMGYRLPDITRTRNAIETFVNGIVDFWCIRDEKVYLFDWKSNQLGPNLSDYHSTALLESMTDHHYHLQYLLYICALNRYLSLVIPNYQYDTHFGGVGYCYLRGVTCEPSISSTNGWFTTLPPADFIHSLGQILEPISSDFSEEVEGGQDVR